MGMVRRRLLLHYVLGLLAAALAVAWYSYAIEPQALRVERVAVPIPGLPPYLDGYTIGVLADLHVGRFTSPALVRRAAARLAAEHPRLVVVAGDFVGGTDTSGLPEALGPLDGAYGVPGNWEYSFGVVRQAGRDARVRLLVNRGALVAPGLWLGGLDDGLLGKVDLDRALEGAPPGATRLLLAHEPDLARLVKPRHRVALLIAGHSHGGQIRLPVVGPPFLPPLSRRYPQGLAAAPVCLVYTSRGIGLSHLPFRLLSPPEVTVITLRRPR